MGRRVWARSSVAAPGSQPVSGLRCQSWCREMRRKSAWREWPGWKELTVVPAVEKTRVLST